MVIFAEIVAASRLALGGVMACAGVAKLADPARFRASVAASGVPAPAVAAVVLPVLELATAAGLLVGGDGRPAGLAALGLLSAFTGVVAIELSMERPPPCGCFGGATTAPPTSRTLVRNGTLMVLAATVVWQGSGPAPLVGLAAAAANRRLAALALAGGAVAASTAALAGWIEFNRRAMQALRSELAPAPGPASPG